MLLTRMGEMQCWSAGTGLAPESALMAGWSSHAGLYRHGQLLTRSGSWGSYQNSNKFLGSFSIQHWL